MGSILIFSTIILLLISDLIGDVKNEIPFSLLIIESIIIYLMSYIERETDEENKNRWIYVGAFFFALIAITYLIFNYNLQ